MYCSRVWNTQSLATVTEGQTHYGPLVHASDNNSLSSPPCRAVPSTVSTEGIAGVISGLTVNTSGVVLANAVNISQAGHYLG